MTTRTTTKTVTFAHPFLLKGIDRILPAGDYRVVTDEELIEGVSFPVYRRVSTVAIAVRNVSGRQRWSKLQEWLRPDPPALRRIGMAG